MEATFVSNRKQLTHFKMMDQRKQNAEESVESHRLFHSDMQKCAPATMSDLINVGHHRDSDHV